MSDPTPRMAPLPDESRERESGVYSTAATSVLLLVREKDATDRFAAGVMLADMVPLPTPSVPSARALAHVPRLAIIDMRMDGAEAFVREFTATGECLVVALVDPGNECSALAAGASEAVPPNSSSHDLATLLKGLQKRQEARREPEQLFQREETLSPLEQSSRLAAAVMHEIRTPLAGALLNVTFLREQIERLPGAMTIAKEIEADLREIERTLSALGSLAGGEAPPPAKLRVRDVTEQIVRRARNPQQVHIAVTGDPKVMAWADHPLYERTIANLLSNALDASNPSRHDQITIHVSGQGEEAHITVRDSGPGVPAALRSRIFEPFFTTKGIKGTGLGLAFCRQAVAAMGGKLTLSDDGLPGACFHIALPRVRG